VRDKSYSLSLVKGERDENGKGISKIFLYRFVKDDEEKEEQESGKRNQGGCFKKKAQSEFMPRPQPGPGHASYAPEESSDSPNIRARI